MVAINFQAASLGSWVSESKVITYFTWVSIEELPVTAENSF